jgi:polyketide biosynthesis 3-hydroxy-3-methylglutaryl-CoA synthase-like enzyme PksG
VIGRPTGIQAAATYCGAAYVDVPALFAARGLDDSRLGNLMMLRKSVPLPCEDIVSFAVNAAAPVVADLSAAERGRLETLIVATESGVDFAKSAATYVHDLLDLPRTCRLFEVKQACHAGIAALQAAAALTAASHDPDALALVIAGDLAAPQRGGYAEPSQGAGAVAVLVGEPRLAALSPGMAGLCSYETTDFCRPRPDLDLVDIDHSLLSYIDCLLGSFSDYTRRVPGTDFRESFAALAMHTPFPGMVKGAHRTVLRKLGAGGPQQAAADFARRVEPSLRLPRQVGNIYSGSTLLALLSLLSSGRYAAGAPIGVFSYGGGCSSEFLLMTAGPQAPPPCALDRDGTGRRELSVGAYDQLTSEQGAGAFGVRDVQLDLDAFGPQLPAGSRLLLLSRIDGYHRSYAWTDGGAP